MLKMLVLKSAEMVNTFSEHVVYRYNHTDTLKKTNCAKHIIAINIHQIWNSWSNLKEWHFNSENLSKKILQHLIDSDHQKQQFQNCPGVDVFCRIFHGPSNHKICKISVFGNFLQYKRT